MSYINQLLSVIFATILTLGPTASYTVAAPQGSPRQLPAFSAWAAASDGSVFSARAVANDGVVFSARAAASDGAVFSARARSNDNVFSATAEREAVLWAQAEASDERAREDRPTGRRPAQQRIMRRRVGQEEGDAVPPEPVFPAPIPAGTNDDAIAIPDRWRLVETLNLKNENLMDPFNQNTLKADRPIFGRNWFLNVLLVSDSLTELRRIPTPVGLQSNASPGRIDAFGDPEQTLFNQNFITSFSLIKGDTVFRPPDWEFRFTGVTNLNYTLAKVAGLLKADPSDDTRRRFDQHFAVQELFVDKHLWNKSDRYDFDSLRIGIQPFISDFRGFLFQDQQPGIRLFGNFINNRIQYNLAWFRRLNKDTNSGLNETNLRSDEVFVANMYYQDFPVLGFQLQGTVIYNKNREGDRGVQFNENNFMVRPASIFEEKPHNYDVFYFGLNGDGHFDRLNLTFSLYHALGKDTRSQIAQQPTDIRAYFGAFEASMDFDWYRLKLYSLYSSGDENPLDSVAEGFDSIFDNPQFGGFDTAFFQRQAIPLIGGGGVILSGRNSFIPSLRSSKEEGQSNFVNPGLRMVGVGADFDILPELRFIFNASYLDFDATASLRVLRNQQRIDRHIGEDVSFAVVYRPLFINNIMVRASVAALFPGQGFDDLFDRRGDKVFYSALANVVLTY